MTNASALSEKKPPLAQSGKGLKIKEMIASIPELSCFQTEFWSKFLKNFSPMSRKVENYQQNLSFINVFQLLCGNFVNEFGILIRILSEFYLKSS